MLSKMPTIEELDHKWDAIIIGGGITGAGIFQQLAAMGYQVLLIDQADFAFGTSSRSSKLVHGGLRYLANAQFHVTYESVRERERLQKQFPHLVKPLRFVIPVYERYSHGVGTFRFGLSLYDIFGSKWQHGALSTDIIREQYSPIQKDGLHSLLYYYDAEVDDARLVLRVIQEGIALGGYARNYCKAVKLLKDPSGKIESIVVKDARSGKESELQASVFINATGPWTDDLRSQMIDEKVIRKLRGSHILLPREKLPVNSAFTIFHPSDGRALFVIPWQGTTMVGTTDLDHPEIFEQEKPEPFMTYEEMVYLLEATNALFPKAKITKSDIISSFAGLRPIVTMGEMAPSKASRIHKIFQEENLFSIAGGKLTTYQRMARDLIKRILLHLPSHPDRPTMTRRSVSKPIQMNEQQFLHLQGIYGDILGQFLQDSQSDELLYLAGTAVSPAELRWAARHEMVYSLSDLLLRRTRIGLTCKQGGSEHFSTVKRITKQELGWTDKEWEHQVDAYRNLWKHCYSIPTK